MSPGYRRSMSKRRILEHPLVGIARERIRSTARNFLGLEREDKATFRLDRQTSGWVFFADSNEPRHLFDIVLGVHVLRARGIPDAHIHVCTSHIAAANHLNPYGITNIHALDQCEAVLGSLNCASVVLIVGGHGIVEGIGQGGRIASPAEVLRRVRAASGIQVGIIVLSQCFAGAFNLLDATSSPPLVLIGATNLNNSISSPITLGKPLPQADGSPGVQSWMANLFSWTFFVWLERQPDVDGDGHRTIMDAYKFAGAMSNQQLLTVKSSLYVEASRIGSELKTLQEKQAAQQPPTTQQEAAQRLMLEVTTKATAQRLQEVLKMLYMHQEPWILNARLARRIIVDL